MTLAGKAKRDPVLTASWQVRLELQLTAGHRAPLLPTHPHVRSTHLADLQLRGWKYNDQGVKVLSAKLLGRAATHRSIVAVEVVSETPQQTPTDHDGKLFNEAQLQARRRRRINSSAERTVAVASRSAVATAQEDLVVEGSRRTGFGSTQRSVSLGVGSEVEREASRLVGRFDTFDWALKHSARSHVPGSPWNSTLVW